MKLRTIVLAAALIAGPTAGAVAAPAAAAPMPGGCVSQFDKSVTQAHPGEIPVGHVDGDWEVNKPPAGCGDTLEMKARCWDGASSAGVTKYSGVVVAQELNDRALCTQSQPYVKRAYYRVNGGSWVQF